MSGSSWRLARSLVRLRDEIEQVAPGTTVWTIGDEHHVVSDHVPNDQGVVCAADILDDAGLDLDDLAETIRTSGHPALKYVIYDRKIAPAGRAWRVYHGDNPHTSHVHVSVGRGPDGQSTGPYDDTSPWGVAPRDEGDDMSILGLKRGNEGERVVALQVMCDLAGQGDLLGRAGVDGIYGPRTAEALLAARRSVGSRAEEGWGDEVDGWAYGQLVAAVALARATVGDERLAEAVAAWVAEHRDELAGIGEGRARELVREVLAGARIKINGEG